MQCPLQFCASAAILLPDVHPTVGRCPFFTTLAGPCCSLPAAEAIDAALDEAEAAGMLFVVAAGNRGTDLDQEPQFPASAGCAGLCCAAGGVQCGAGRSPLAMSQSLLVTMLLCIAACLLGSFQFPTPLLLHALPAPLPFWLQEGQCYRCGGLQSHR